MSRAEFLDWFRREQAVLSQAFDGNETSAAAG